MEKNWWDGNDDPALFLTNKLRDLGMNGAVNVEVEITLRPKGGRTEGELHRIFDLTRRTS